MRKKMVEVRTTTKKKKKKEMESMYRKFARSTTKMKKIRKSAITLTPTRSKICKKTFQQINNSNNKKNKSIK